MLNTNQKNSLKQWLPFAEKLSIFLVVVVGLAWLFGARPLPPPAKRAYHFKGEFCGLELWEYSANGNEVAIWSEWTTNFGNSGPIHMLCVRTGTVAEFVNKK